MGIGALLGHYLRERDERQRRQRIRAALRTHDLSGRERSALEPYVEYAVEKGAGTGITAFAVFVLGALGLGLLVLGIAFADGAVSLLLVVLGLGAFAGVAFLYRRTSTAAEIQSTLENRPQDLLSPRTNPYPAVAPEAMVVAGNARHVGDPPGRSGGQWPPQPRHETGGDGGRPSPGAPANTAGERPPVEPGNAGRSADGQRPARGGREGHGDRAPPGSERRGAEGTGPGRRGSRERPGATGRGAGGGQNDGRDTSRSRDAGAPRWDGTEDGPGEHYCTRCGAAQQPSHSFCRACGASLEG